MKDINLINYAVKGIKSLDEKVNMSFYKKTLVGEDSFKNYNVKAIYGENGAGKSGIITSSRILKELIVNPDYLGDRLIQRKLSELINKKLGYIEFTVEYYVVIERRRKLYRYTILVSKNLTDKYFIKEESLYSRNADSHDNKMKLVYEVVNGDIQSFRKETSEFTDSLREKSKNLLQNSSLSSVCLKKMVLSEMEKNSKSEVQMDIVLLYLFGCSIYTYLDSEDEHTAFFINDILDKQSIYLDKSLVDLGYKMIPNKYDTNLLSLYPGKMTIDKNDIDLFEKQIDHLKRFIKIFKSKLQDITIEKKDDGQSLSCEMIMVYKECAINSEFESTGIKKLIKLYSHIQRVVEGDIVFIDELDSNLHDVYLCALLEYLMKYGKGQLCFTTHNIGPMDVLKKNKKSIDFLSADQHIYPWVANGNYSPAKLYKEGMISGSPFNVDAIDFIGVLDDDSEE